MEGKWKKKLELSRKDSKNLVRNKYFGCKFSQEEELIQAGVKQGCGWNCCPRK